MPEELHPALDVDDAGQVSLGVAGDQLELEALSRGPSRCQWCGGEAVDGSTCPRSIACPGCDAPAGSPCRRPSTHRADVMHAARWQAAEAIDAAATEELEQPIAGQLELEEV